MENSDLKIPGDTCTESSAESADKSSNQQAQLNESENVKPPDKMSDSCEEKEANTLESIDIDQGAHEKPAFRRMEKRTSESSDEEPTPDRLLMNQDQLPAPTPVTLPDDDWISEKDSIDKDEIVVTVKFRTDTNETMTSAFMICSKLFQVKERLANIFKLNVTDIRLTFEGKECDDLVPLSGLGVKPLGTIELGLHPTDPHKILAPVEFSHYIPIVDVITVRVPGDAGTFKDIVVEIENQCLTKRWLGGYRHRITKVEYHHAEIQTLPRRRPSNSLAQRSSITQTPMFPLRATAVGTLPCKATQVTSADFKVPFIDDRLVCSNAQRFAPKDGAAYFQLLVAVIIRIRRYCHRFKERPSKQERRMPKRRAQPVSVEESQKPSTDGRMVGGSKFPVNRGNLNLLYLLIGKWWRREMANIASTKSNESRKAALVDLLNREVELISVIDRQRIEAKRHKLLKQEVKHLEAVARPVIFRDSKGGLLAMDTLATQRAKACQEMMQSFLKCSVPKQQRLDVLRNVKRLISSYQLNYEHTQEIVGLLDRECQLLALGVSAKQMQGLRDRVTQLLFHFMHKYIIGTDRNASFKAGTPLYYCLHCRKLKPASEFDVHIKMASFTTCRACQWTRNIAIDRIDLSPFARLLAQVRQTEMQNGCYSSPCYTLQVIGMYYLTRHIWYCRSIISDTQNLNDLQMARFRKKEDWSPWNCILLTSQETAAHLDIVNIDQFYSRPLLEKVRYRHLRAKNHFMPLLLNDKFLAESRSFFKSGDNQI